MNTTTATIARTFARRLGINLLIALALGTVLLYGMATREKESVARPAADGSAVALVEAHGCSNAVTDPTHAVVTVDGVTRYVGQRMTGKAIEQVAFGVDHGMMVHGFCE